MFEKQAPTPNARILALHALITKNFRLSLSQQDFVSLNVPLFNLGASSKDILIPLKFLLLDLRQRLIFMILLQRSF